MKPRRTEEIAATLKYAPWIKARRWLDMKPWACGVSRFNLRTLDCRAINSDLGLYLERVTMTVPTIPVSPPAAPERKFTVNSLDELKDCLRRVDEIVQQSDGSSTSMALVAQRLRTIARDALIYSRTLTASATDRRDERSRNESFIRKSGMVRLILQDFTGRKVADHFGVTTSLVSQNARSVVRMMRFRLRRFAEEVNGRRNPLLDLDDSNIFKMLSENRLEWLPVLDKLDYELSRKSQGQPWDDLWGGTIPESIDSTLS